MCGIAGIVGVDHPEPGLTERMTDALFHRGPDSGGIFQNSISSIGARRLSIIDIDHGQQPITDDQAGIAIAFNGEIYNYRELRNHLTQLGHRFKTTSDTEVVLHLYQEYGVDCLERLQGMFAFAIVSATQVFLARDRFGIKPLFWARHPTRDLLLFASEIKALLKCMELKISLNENMLIDSYVLGYGTGPQTALNEIMSLQPGHSMLIQPGTSGLEILIRRYFVPKVSEQFDGEAESAMSLAQNALEQAIQRHLQADVEIGCTLSGGLDSTLMTYLAQKFQGSTMTFSIACDPDNVDLAAARSAADAMRTLHAEMIPSFEEYLGAIPSYLLAIEVPQSLHALPFFMLCKHISGSLKVCLNGEGADELFGGYDCYIQQRSTLLSLRQKLINIKRLGFRISSWAREMLGELDKIRSIADYKQYLPILLKLLQQDQLEHNHLLFIDRCSMASSVEMRVPFLDDVFASVINALPASLKVNSAFKINKYLLKRIALQYGKHLHDPVLRAKDGLPGAGMRYLRRFEDLCEASVSDQYAENHQFGSFFCSRDSKGKLAGKERLLLFDTFCDIFISRRGAHPPASLFEDIFRDAAQTDISRGQLAQITH